MSSSFETFVLNVLNENFTTNTPDVKKRFGDVSTGYVLMTFSVKTCSGENSVVFFEKTLHVQESFTVPSSTNC